MLFQIRVVRTKFDIYVLFSLPNVSEAHPVCSLLTPCALISEFNKLRQNGDIKSCWSYGGRIFAQVHENSEKNIDQGPK